MSNVHAPRSVRLVGATPIHPSHRLSCHCGAVVLRLSLPEGIQDARRCDCSMCRRRGAIVASVPLDGITVEQGADVLREYRFNTHTARHFFCGVCGIYTHHQRRSNPQQYGYNVGCLEGVNPFELGDVPTNDGVLHPADRHTPWLHAARAELGVVPHGPGSCNPRITAYHHGTSIHGYDDKCNWCSTFVHWCLGQAGVQGTASALARSWLAWGEPLEAPRPGCITVLWREDPNSWQGHVGFYVRHDDEHVWLLGGNQQGTVREWAYPLSTVLGHRWPSSSA
ncbi:TIGR02594 family protein [Ideonella margarita]|uniref:TIGR02594 family protein n=1 Tax=Ideonella margarita TaxID=2984191 RepID=A0ABU9C795_9BURK